MALDRTEKPVLAGLREGEEQRRRLPRLDVPVWLVTPCPVIVSAWISRRSLIASMR
jgi:hypothetical protein